VDVRLVATTNRNLSAEVEAGRFRRDLFYRLNVVPIRTPPLRERIEDIPLLVQHFLTSAAAGLGIRPPRVTPEMIEALKRRHWPGNIRELANIVERAVIMSRGEGLPPNVFDDGAGAIHEPSHATASAPLPVADPTFNLKELERLVIERAIAAAGGHRGRAAKLLGISDRTLRNRLKVPHGS
jgi:DNA-binding NtrC family response regulator